MPKTFRYCPFCAFELIPKDVNGREYKACQACGFVDYQNARATAGAIVTNDKGEILVARRAFEPKKGGWNLPGGFVEYDEHPQAAMVRELKEETGLDVRPIRFLTIQMDTYDDPKQGFFQTLNVYYIAEIIRGTVTANDDALELKFFSLDEVPPMAFECEERVLEDYKNLLKSNAEKL